MNQQLQNIYFKRATRSNLAVPVYWIKCQAMGHLIKRATEIRVQPRNLNRDGGFQYQSVLLHVTDMIKQY
jgi:hypothetical protein